MELEEVKDGLEVRMVRRADDLMLALQDMRERCAYHIRGECDPTCRAPYWCQPQVEEL